MADYERRAVKDIVARGFLSVELPSGDGMALCGELEGNDYCGETVEVDSHGERLWCKRHGRVQEFAVRIFTPGALKVWLKEETLIRLGVQTESKKK